jgi:uncharacterized membrane-anchored protein YitT (DUF2179 family)
MKNQMKINQINKENYEKYLYLCLIVGFISLLNLMMSLVGMAFAPSKEQNWISQIYENQIVAWILIIFNIPILIIVFKCLCRINNISRAIYSQSKTKETLERVYGKEYMPIPTYEEVFQAYYPTHK